VTNAEIHSRIRALLGAYALGAVDQAERADLDAHLADCRSCRRELAQLREAAGMLPSVPRPPDELWQRIVDDVRALEEAQREDGGGGDSD
jgi:anti-sigma factor RsiW